MRITSGGNVLIGTTTDNGYKLNVNGSIYTPAYMNFSSGSGQMYIAQANQISSSFNSTDFLIYNTTASSGRVIVATNAGSGAVGVILNNNATSWSSYSDERLKNINGNIENAVDKLLTLRTVDYSWKSDSTNKHNLGLIAQDIQKVFPQIVDEDKNKEKLLMVRYTELIPVLVKAIQEQNQLIKELQQEIQDLKKQIKN